MKTHYVLCVKWNDGWHALRAYTSMEDALYNAEPITVPCCISEWTP